MSPPPFQTLTWRSALAVASFLRSSELVLIRDCAAVSFVLACLHVIACVCVCVCRYVCERVCGVCDRVREVARCSCCHVFSPQASCCNAISGHCFLYIACAYTARGYGPDCTSNTTPVAVVSFSRECTCAFVQGGVLSCVHCDSEGDRSHRQTAC